MFVFLIITAYYPDDLKFVTLPVIAKTTCNQADSYNGEVMDGMICIGDMNGGQDSCQVKEWRN